MPAGGIVSISTDFPCFFKTLNLNNMQTEINKAKVIELLLGANWSWVTSGGRVRESDMNEFCEEIIENISEEAINEVLNECAFALQSEYEQLKEYQEESDLAPIDEFAATAIADQVAQSLVSGVDESVSFIAYI